MDLLGEQALAADIGQAAVLHLSPVVLIDMLLEHVDAAQHRAEGAQRARKARVWTSASGEPRVPTRSGSAARHGSAGRRPEPG